MVKISESELFLLPSNMITVSEHMTLPHNCIRQNDKHYCVFHLYMTNH